MFGFGLAYIDHFVEYLLILLVLEIFKNKFMWTLLNRISYFFINFACTRIS